MPFKTEAEILASTVKLEYWCYPFIQKKGSMFISAPPKSMKSILAVQMMLSINRGQKFFGWETEPASILYVDQEMGEPVLRERLKALPEISLPSIKPIHFFTDDGRRLSLDPGTVGRSDLYDGIRDLRPDVVVFDSFRKMTGKDENSSAEMTKVFESLKLLQHEFNFSSVFIHHTRKVSDAKGGKDQENMRGSSEIYAHGDAYGMIHMQNDMDPTLNWSFRNHAPIGDMELRLVPVTPETGYLIRRPAENIKKLKLTKDKVRGEDLTYGAKNYIPID
jgi:RecA-family ATPase